MGSAIGDPRVFSSLCLSAAAHRRLATNRIHALDTLRFAKDAIS
jgi:hypothetical protein